MNRWSWKPASSSAFPSVAELPGSPTQGQTVLHSATKLPLQWNGAAWVSLRPGVAIYPNPGGLTAPRAVTLVDGSLVSTNPATHTRSDGLLSHIIDANLVAVTRDGEVDGFVGLTANGALYVGSGGAGPVTHDPDPTLELLPVGYALSATKAMARMDTGTGFG